MIPTMTVPPAQSQGPAAPGSGRGRSQLALIATTDFAVWLGAGTIIPYLPVFLLEQAHASVSLIGLIAAAYFVGVFAFSTYLGHLSDRVGRKPMIIAGTVLYTVATALFLTTTQPAWFIVFRFVEGVGAAAVVPAAQAFVADITQNENRSRAYGWLTSAQFSGLIIGPALAWPLYALGGGRGVWAFYTIFIFDAALTAIVALVLALFLHEPRHVRAARREASARRPPLRSLLSRPVLAIIVVVASSEFAMGGWEVVWSIWLRHLGASFRVIGLTWVAFSVPVAFSFVGGRLADRRSRYALMVWGFAITGASWIVFSLTHDLTVYLAAMLVGGGAFAVAFPAKQAFLVQVSAPRWLGSIQGVEQTAMQLAALVGTLTAQLIYSVIGGYIFAVGGVVALLGIVVAAPALRREWACVAGRSDARSCADLRRLGLGPDYAVEYSSDGEPGALSRARRESPTGPPDSIACPDRLFDTPSHPGGAVESATRYGKQLSDRGVAGTGVTHARRRGRARSVSDAPVCGSISSGGDKRHAQIDLERRDQLRPYQCAGDPLCGGAHAGTALQSAR